MRKSLLLLLFLVTGIFTYSQSSTVKGTVTDSVDKKNLVNTAIALLSTPDSVLVKFARADKDGNFSFAGVKDGKFILMATHPYLGDYFDNVEVKGGAVDLGKIYMTPKSKLLAEVIIKSGSPIRIKGDTTIYTADSFKVRAGANVEELLRRLPGIQVDKDGKITAMGERVKKVLVDGEEFFGSDPGIATKNLRADAVQEVQVFDKKSDQAEFTGIDDGVKDKTINLKMKDKRGYFGKVEAGGGLKNKFSNDAMFNSFRKKRKIAAYGVMSNTGKTNLDWQDAQNYGGGEIDGMSTGISDDGGMYISFNGGGDDNYWGGRNGIPQNWNGGLHYSNKFNKDKLSLNTGYKFSKVNSNGVTTTFSNVFLPDSSWTSNSINNNFSSINKHAFNLTLDANLDSNNSLKWTTKLNNNNSKTVSHYYSEAINEAGQFINNSTRNSDNNSDKNNITSSLLWRHKFKKLSRTLSINGDFNWTQVKTNGLLFSLNNYFVNGVLNDRDTTDQLNVQDNISNGIKTKIAYTEPLMKNTYLELNYSLAYNNSSNDRIITSKSPNGKYEDIIDTLSNSFVFNRLVNQPGANIRVTKKKYNFSFGASVGLSNFVQKNITEDTKTNYNYTNFFPQANFNYKLKSNQNLRFNYNGASTAPTLEQLQPIRVNTDPLNVYIGNPNLNQSFKHTFNVGFNSYNTLKEKGFYSNANFNFTQNAFVQSSLIDSVGKRTYQTVNASGVYNSYVSLDYYFKIKGFKPGIGLSPNGNFSKNIDFVNGVKNITTNNNYGVRVNINRYVVNKFNFYLGPGITWNHSKATINKAADADYWQLDAWMSGSYNLPKKFEISSDFNIEARQKDPRFTKNNNFSTWNAALIKRFMKENQLELKLNVYDVLNQNKGYDRNFNSSSFTETYYATLKRFWLLTVTWNISKNGKPAGFN